ncbi:MAG: hypothetical protein R2712_18160 [Vicinamibacterales bacterium]
MPARAIGSGRIGRFGASRPTDGGNSYRCSGSFSGSAREENATTRVTAYNGLRPGTLFSNFTYFLEDPDNGDQFEQADHRFVTGALVSHRRPRPPGRAPTQHTIGLQLRDDDIIQHRRPLSHGRPPPRIRCARTPCSRPACRATRRTRRRGHRGCGRSRASVSIPIAST